MPTPFHIMAKPMGAACNLACQYCFYLEKTALYPQSGRSRASDPVLRSYIQQYIASQPGSEVSFAWQGGEPTLYGLEGFRRIVAWQQEFARGRKITNAIQTNGTLLNADWARFFRDHQFLVGISIDGPRELHNAFRLDRRGGPTFDEVMRGLKLLRKYKVDFNTLTVVNRRNARHPGKVYDFLKKIGSRYWQFIPLVERHAAPCPGTPTRQTRPGPPPLQSAPSPLQAETVEGKVTSWSVEPETFGIFLCGIFDRWVTKDVGRIFVQAFDGALAQWMGRPGGLCVHEPTCGQALAMEHNGDIYACDHYVYEDYRRGNLLETPLEELATDPRQKAFGQAKKEGLSEKCRSCPWLFACAGGCPKHRFADDGTGQYRQNYLCPGYQRFFQHIAPAMQTMGTLWRHGQPPARIMETGIL